MARGRVSRNAVFPSPLEGEGARRADEGFPSSALAWAGAAPLTLENPLDADFLSLSLRGRGEGVP